MRGYLGSKVEFGDIWSGAGKEGVEYMRDRVKNILVYRKKKINFMIREWV